MAEPRVHGTRSTNGSVSGTNNAANTDLDARTAKLLETVSQLYALADEEDSPIKKRTELKDVETAVKNIASLARTIKLYDDADRRMPHIAFLGQFSSGKSSLINALVRENMRRTGAHPVDKWVTVISHVDNVDRGDAGAAHLTDFTSHMRTPVFSETSTNPFFKDRHLVDMPGSGESEQLEELVREFLPICDWIFVLMVPMHANDMSDARLLKVLHRSLREIKLGLVITHGDYFASSDRTKFESAKFDPWLRTLKERVVPQLGEFPFHAIFPVSNHQDSPGVPVDFTKMPDGLGIAELRHAIETLPIDLARMHDKKIELFTRWTSDRAAALWSFLDELDTSVTNLIRQVEAKRAAYEASYKFSLDKYDMFWNRMQKGIDERVSKINEKKSEKAESFSNGVERAKFFSETPAALSETSIKLIDELVENAARQARVNTRKRIDATRRLLVQRIENTTLKWTDELALLADDLPLPPAERIAVDSLVLTATSIHGNEAKVYRDRAERTQKDGLVALGKHLDSLLGSEHDQHMIDQLLDFEQRSAFEGFRSTQRGEVPTILEHVKGYHNIVIADSNHALIGKTGFGEQLDTLQKMTMPEADKVIERIEQGIFVVDEKRLSRLRVREALRRRREDFEQTITDSYRAKEQIRDLTKTLEANWSEMNDVIAATVPEQARRAIAAAAADLSAPQATDVQTALKEWEKVLKRAHDAAVDEYKTQSANIAKEVRSRLWRSLGWGFTIFVIVMVGTFFKGVDSIEDWIKAAVLGVLSNALASSIIYAYHAITNSKEKLVLKKRWSILNEQRDKVLAELNPDGAGGPDTASSAARADQSYGIRVLDHVTMPSADQLASIKKQVADALLEDVRHTYRMIADAYKPTSGQITRLAANVETTHIELLDAYLGFLADITKWYTSGPNRKTVETEFDGHRNETIEQALNMFKAWGEKVSSYKKRIENLIGHDRLMHSVEEAARAKVRAKAEAELAAVTGDGAQSQLRQPVEVSTVSPPGHSGFGATTDVVRHH